MKQAYQNISEVVKLTDFIRPDFDTTKERGVTFIGDYRARWMSHDGTNRPQSPFRSNSAIGSRKRICTILIAIVLNNAFVLVLMLASTHSQISPLSVA